MIMNRRYTSPRNSGFSLIELTCAMFIISLGLFAVVHVYLQGIEKMRAIDEYETALCALNNEIETLRALPGLFAGGNAGIHRACVKTRYCLPALA